MSSADEPRPSRPKPLQPGGNPGSAPKPKPRSRSSDVPADKVGGGWRPPVDPNDEANTFTRQPSASKKGRTPIPATGGPKLMERIIFGRVSTTHLATFCRQFATYSDAGVDLVKSLESLREQYTRTALGPILGRVIIQVRSGEALSDAMAQEPEAFDRLFLSMIRVAEARGGIPETMRMLAEQYEARLRLIRQARSAMIYPVIVLVVALGVMILLTTVVLPTLASFLADMSSKGELPFASKVLMIFSNFIKAFGWWVAPVLTIMTIFMLFRLYKTRSGKVSMDELGLMTPVLGKLLRLLEISRFSRTLSTLLNAGVDMNSALVLTSEVMRLEPYRRAVDGTRTSVKDGEELSVALNDTRRFTSDVIALVNSGEETGRVPECLNKVADDYEEQASYMVKNLSQFIQPIILVCLGGLVLFILLAVFQPIIKMIQDLAGGG